VKYPPKAKESDEYTLNPSKSRWVRVFTLDDGTKWTVTELQKKLNFKHKVKFSTSTARGRLLKYTSPEKVFMPLNKTKLAGRKKGYQRPTTKEEIESREMMNLALRSIGGGK
jgi:hypothetical protein